HVKLLYSEPAGKGCGISAGQLVSHLDLESEDARLPDCLELVIWNAVTAFEISDFARFELRGPAVILNPGPAARHEKLNRQLCARGNGSCYVELDPRGPAPGILILVIDNNRPVPDRCAYSNRSLEDSRAFSSLRARGPERHRHEAAQCQRLYHPRQRMLRA